MPRVCGRRIDTASDVLTGRHGAERRLAVRLGTKTSPKRPGGPVVMAEWGSSAELTYFDVMRRQLALSATARIRRAKIQVFALELSHEVSAANRERLVRPLNAGGGKGRHGTDSRESDHPGVPAWRQIKKAGGLRPMSLPNRELCYRKPDRARRSKHYAHEQDDPHAISLQGRVHRHLLAVDRI